MFIQFGSGAGRRVRRLLLAVMLFAGMSQVVSSRVDAASAPWRETLLHSFAGSDGTHPFANVIADPSGNLYGTTGSGGCPHNCQGTVFELTPPGRGQTRWTQTVLHAFPPGRSGDGALPKAGLYRDARGALYGTTLNGGSYGPIECADTGCGVVFRLSPPCCGQTQWRETILHAFSYVDGWNPDSTLVADSSGALYGTTESGGPANYGNVFELRPPTAGTIGWTLRVVHAFGGGSDGEVGAGVAAGPHGTIYGTTFGGIGGGGIAFALEAEPAPALGWRERLIYSFSNAGLAAPSGLLADPRGFLFGTAYAGPGSGAGTVFALTPPLFGKGAWQYHQLYRFSNAASTGGYPASGVIADGSGVLYGTTSALGPHDEGSVYSLTPPPSGETTWVETSVHLFGLVPGDGHQPQAALLFDTRGNLYGTTSAGGADDQGTVFELSRP